MIRGPDVVLERRTMAQTTGIHHVTAISGEPQRNVDFYAGVLGLRLVKKTVNFDDPETYHLYYGDGGGNPGTIMTFFPWAHAPGGRIGAGQLIVTSFSIPISSLGYWTERLVEGGVRFERPRDRFGDTVLTFEDPDRLRIELVATEDARPGWAGGTVTEEYSVRGFHHVALAVENIESTVSLMTGVLGFGRVDEMEGRVRLSAGEDGPGNTVDVHHVAFRVPDEETQLALREEISGLGYNVTPVLDRNYFRSIYFREPGGVLFEIATDPPGFAVDEDEAELGTHLKLPPWLETRRGRLEEVLPPLEVPVGESA
jgi:glyoxalase family protein